MDAPKYFSLASSSQHILYSSKQQNMRLGETLRTSFFEESRATSFLIPESILQVVQNNGQKSVNKLLVSRLVSRFGEPAPACCSLIWGLLVHHCLDADVGSETSIVIISCWMKTNVHPQYSCWMNINPSIHSITSFLVVGTLVQFLMLMVAHRGSYAYIISLFGEKHENTSSKNQYP